MRFLEELTSPEQDDERRRAINEATNKAQAQMKAAEDFQRDWNLNHV